MRIALATSANLPDLIPDEAPLREAFARLGVEAPPAVWSDPGVDWGSFDAVLIRTTWDYTTRLGEFLAWAERVEAATPLLNPARVLRWNTHKRYLNDLAALGVRTLPMEILPRGSSVDLAAAMRERGWGRAVLKPAVGATARRQERASLDPLPGFLTVEAGQGHLDAALADEDMLLQPFASSVSEDGEVSVMLVDGEATHAVRKRAKPGDYRVQTDWGGTVERAVATEAEAAAAERVVAAMGSLGIADAPLVYARVDLVAWEGGPALIELEVAEPQMFLLPHPAAAAGLAEAALRRARG